MKTYKQSIILAAASTAQAATISSIYKGDLWLYERDNIDISDFGELDGTDIIDWDGTDIDWDGSDIDWYGTDINWDGLEFIDFDVFFGPVL